MSLIDINKFRNAEILDEDIKDKKGENELARKLIMTYANDNAKSNNVMPSVSEKNTLDKYITGFLNSVVSTYGDVIKDNYFSTDDLITRWNVLTTYFVNSINPLYNYYVINKFSNDIISRLTDIVDVNENMERENADIQFGLNVDALDMLLRYVKGGVLRPIPYSLINSADKLSIARQEELEAMKRDERHRQRRARGEDSNTEDERGEDERGEDEEGEDDDDDGNSGDEGALPLVPYVAPELPYVEPDYDEEEARRRGEEGREDAEQARILDVSVGKYNRMIEQRATEYGIDARTLKRRIREAVETGGITQAQFHALMLREKAWREQDAKDARHEARRARGEDSDTEEEIEGDGRRKKVVRRKLAYKDASLGKTPSGYATSQSYPNRDSVKTVKAHYAGKGLPKLIRF